MFEHYGLEWEISRAVRRKVWLRSGGYIIIDRTEALTAVDVNSGDVTRRYESAAFTHPHGSAISPDGRYLFISGNGPGGMQMDMGMDMEGMDHSNMDHSTMDHSNMDHGEMEMDDGVVRHEAETPTTGTLAVIDLESGEVVKVLEMGENTTGVGARR